ncbi:MAG: 4-(cytidine 5'-diphospho)-2-C-methyl-D-erythritol kinase [Candidatus Puniceispirillum sp.]
MTGNIITEMAPAKINLYLRICGRRDDGYHLLDSAVIFTAFGDRISLTPATTDSLTITGAFADALIDQTPANPASANSAVPDASHQNLSPNLCPNLCMQALAAFRDAGGVIAPLAITLDKRIPVGAGLGGGSADAAAILRALNANADHPVTSETLDALAASLGADVPACLRAHSLRMTGIGDQITPLTLAGTASSVTDTPISVLLANPMIPLATADVFRSLNTAGSGHAGTIDAFDIPALAGLGNDLTETACQLVPEIATLLALLQQQSGCRIAAMSGSGASCFALFDHAAACNDARDTLRQSGFWAEATHII